MTIERPDDFLEKQIANLLRDIILKRIADAGLTSSGVAEKAGLVPTACAAFLSQPQWNLRGALSLANGLDIRVEIAGTDITDASNNSGHVATINPEKYKQLANLKDGWDGYSAKAVSAEALRVLANTWAVPTGGGIQFEWHVNGYDIELEFDETGKPVSFYQSVAEVKGAEDD